MLTELVRSPELNICIGLFWGAALKKVPEGAWVPLMMGVILYVPGTASCLQLMSMPCVVLP